MKKKTKKNMAKSRNKINSKELKALSCRIFTQETVQRTSSSIRISFKGLELRPRLPRGGTLIAGNSSSSSTESVSASRHWDFFYKLERSSHGASVVIADHEEGSPVAEAI